MIGASSPDQSGELLEGPAVGETVHLRRTDLRAWAGGPGRSTGPKRLSGRANVMAAASPTPLAQGETSSTIE